MEDKILFKEESYIIIGACMKVHRGLGPGFLESVYEEALEQEFKVAGIPFERQVKLNIFYEDRKLKKYFIADFVCFDKIILEIKSVKYVPVAFLSQLNNYLAATRKELGVLVNFGTTSLTYKRIINTTHSR
ncbi:GxxExxY protein [Salinimicrobium sp. TIG7-5_MAKvit]|uniref:GxxExxY protein n=1 Tax=Salinimicrobium sp. TIG7-5_MAKvit TaxID=3121289 RepID=UPI003C6E9F26